MDAKDDCHSTDLRTLNMATTLQVPHRRLTVWRQKSFTESHKTILVQENKSIINLLTKNLYVKGNPYLKYT